MEPGTKLGPYEITEQLGAGGMGEVYLAQDTRLGRKNVAPSPRAFPLLPLLAISASVLISACGGASSEPVAIRLLDQFESAVIEGGPTKLLELPTGWRFDGPTPATLIGKAAATFGWQAGPGVASLTVRDGRLVGRATTDFPIVHVERASGLDDADVLQAVEVRLRVSKGTNLSMALTPNHPETGADFREVLDQARAYRVAPLTTPVLPGDQLQTYILTAPPRRSPSIRRVTEIRRGTNRGVGATGSSSLPVSIPPVPMPLAPPLAQLLLAILLVAGGGVYLRWQQRLSGVTSLWWTPERLEFGYS